MQRAWGNRFVRLDVPDLGRKESKPAIRAEPGLPKRLPLKLAFSLACARIPQAHNAAVTICQNDSLSVGSKGSSGKGPWPWERPALLVPSQNDRRATTQRPNVR